MEQQIKDYQDQLEQTKADLTKSEGERIKLNDMINTLKLELEGFQNDLQERGLSFF